MMLVIAANEIYTFYEVSVPLYFKYLMSYAMEAKFSATHNLAHNKELYLSGDKNIQI